MAAALLIGNYDGYVGMTHDIFAVYGQHHLAATNANWKVGAPEFTWEAVMEAFFPRPGLHEAVCERLARRHAPRAG